MRQNAVAAQPATSAGSTPQNVELRHLRYFVAIAEAGTFTQAAERLFIAQPTLSQQLRRLEDIVGTQLLDRRREGVQLTTAGGVLLETSRTILSLVDHGVSHTRQAAGLGRQRLRVIMPPHLPDALAAETASRLMSAAVAADVDVTWLEASRGRGQVPGPPVRVTLGVAGRGQRLMRPPPGGRRGGVVGRRAHQRMPEPDPGRPGHQPLHLGQLGHLRIDLQVPGGPPHLAGIA